MNPGFNCNSALPLIDKVTTGVQSFVLVIAHVVAWFAAKLDVTQLANQVRMRLISPLMALQ